MRNSNFGFTFFDAVINFLTGQHTYFLISNKEQRDYGSYDRVSCNENYSGSFQPGEYKELILSEYDGISRNSGAGRKYDSHSDSRQLSSEVPEMFSLSQNFPNPFKEKTMINYQCPMSCFVSIKVYNAMWKEITTLVYENQSAGTYQTVFDGSALDEGIYFYRMDTENFSDTKKMFIEKNIVS